MALVLLNGSRATRSGYCIRLSPTLLGCQWGYGGPPRFFACRDEYKRAMPGRIIGVSRDAVGNRALRMAMQLVNSIFAVKKANSNICTSQVLLAIIAAMYAVYHGPEGLKILLSVFIA